MKEDFNFATLENEDLKEDSVREFILAPLLKELGFVLKNKNTKNPLQMILSLKLTSPTITGSNEKITLTRFPDYVLYLDSKPHCVLDAKAPNKRIGIQSEAERQAFYYAINPELKAPFYALCNGRVWNLFETSSQSLVHSFSCEELFEGLKSCHSKQSEESKKSKNKDSSVATPLQNDNSAFKLLQQILSTPLESLRQNLATNTKMPKKPDEWYLSRELPKAILKPQKRAKARYYGRTAYFTRQSWDIVTQNIKNFTEGEYYELMAKFENVILLINERFDYEPISKLYHIRDEASILNYGIPVEERARYYVLGEFTKAKHENKGVELDKLSLCILPLLKNGIQANAKMIKEILNEIADEDKTTGQWRLKDKKGTQGSLLDN